MHDLLPDTGAATVPGILIETIYTMKSQTIKNTILDEIHDCTYVVMAKRILTDGEIYSTIRVELLRRGGKFPARGETLVIAAEKGL